MSNDNPDTKTGTGRPASDWKGGERRVRPDRRRSDRRLDERRQAGIGEIIDDRRGGGRRQRGRRKQDSGSGEEQR